jgi:hypothetical protein
LSDEHLREFLEVQAYFGLPSPALVALIEAENYRLHLCRSALQHGCARLEIQHRFAKTFDQGQIADRDRLRDMVRVIAASSGR